MTARIFIAGDLHIPIDIGKLNYKKWPESKNLSKNDFLIVCGDFGLIWDLKLSKTEKYWIKWFNERAYTTLFIDGNHENFSRLFALPEKEMFNGKVGVVSDSIFYLKRGEIYVINDKKFFCFGGAQSIDRHLRTLNVSWWEEEIPSTKEMEYAIENLKRYDNKVDYIISHTMPRDFVDIYFAYNKSADPTANFLKFIYDNVTFEHAYNGHFHKDIEIDKYTVLFDKIVEI